MARFSFLLGLCLTCLTSTQAFAQTGESPIVPSTPVTTWAVRIAPGSRCAENQAFANTVSAQIPFANRASQDAAELLAEVNLSEAGLARVLVFDRVLQAEAGSRELQLNSRSCDDSAEAVALVLAVLVEAGRGALSVAPPPAPLPPLPEPQPDPPPPVRPAPPPARVELRHPWLGPRAGHELVAAVGLGFGLLPSPALGGTVEWGMRIPKLWPIYLQLTGFHRNPTSDVGARLSAVYAGLLTCPWTPSWDRVRSRACAGAAIGALWAEGVGLPTNESKTNALYVLGVEVAANVRLVGPLEFVAMFRGDAYPERYLFFYKVPNGRTWLHRSKPVSASLFTGLALRFR